MTKNIDTETIQRCIKEIIAALGDDPEREGLKDTPKRVADMYAEVFAGMTLTNDEIAEMFSKTFDEEDYFVNQYKNIVMVRDIPVFSFCEHHMALMYNMRVSVCYIPKDKIIGLSKIARIADMVSRRLQLQERIGSDISKIMRTVTGSEDVGVIISGEHSCMTSRGIKKPGAATTTATFTGAFLENESLRSEALLLLGGQKNA